MLERHLTVVRLRLGLALSITRKDNLIVNPKELQEFAGRYAKAWSSQDPTNVAKFYAEAASLRVNDDAPAVGRKAIAELAQGFMTAFPDMVVSFDKLLPNDNGAEFHWTLTGINTGPGGTGMRVRISGYELWQIDATGLIAESWGQFDSAEYERQLKEGVNDE